jgi:CheY-like chemotaxis protein
MVVDDDDDVRRMLCVILEGEGYDTVGAADGIEALERMRRDPPSLVFVDLMMPRMDGAHLIRSMNDDAVLSHIPIAIMSGQTTAPADALAKAKARLMKPVELDDVLTLANRYIHAA